jgi:hypothetical protein
MAPKWAAIQERRQAARREPVRRPGDAPRPRGRPQRATPRSPGPARVGPRPKREKMFGEGRAIPLDRNAKARITTLARALMRPAEKGKHWGPITAKFFEVLQALLWAFHNAKSGRCFPSYETIARKAKCGEDTVARAIVALEQVGLLSWCNRLVRVTIKGVVKVIRTSNAYWFNDPALNLNLSQEPVSRLIKKENRTALVAPKLSQGREEGAFNLRYPVKR